ncbi:MAG: hypothetical protein AAGK97_00410, partial [Bacteroidota bacterium]
MSTKHILIIFFFIPHLMLAQNNDCIDTIVICSDNQIMFNPDGSGDVEDLNAGNQGCLLRGENSSAWYYFETNSNTPPNILLGFTLTPDAATGEDYDFAIYGPNVDCSNLGQPIRCSYADGFCNFCPQTGLGMGAVDTSDVDDDGFVRELTVSANQGYFLLIDNFSSSGSGFSIDWTAEGANYLNCIVNCDIAIEAIDTTICQGDDPVALDLVYTSNSMNGENISWTSSSGSEAFLSATDIQNPIVTVPSDFSGEIVYEVIVEDMNGVCMDQEEVRILVEPEVSITIADTTLCQGANSFNLNVATSGNIAEVEWENVDGNLSWLSDLSLNPSVSIPPNFSGSTTFTIRIYNSGRLCTAETQFNINVDDAIISNLQDSIALPCQGEVELSTGILPQPGAIVSWTLNGTEVSNAESFMADMAGTYIASINLGTCERVDSTVVFNVEGIEDVMIDNNNVLCTASELGEISIISIIGGTEPISWSLDGGPAMNDLTIQGITQGDHQLVFTDANNCVFN